jgi:hypothetical protein
MGGLLRASLLLGLCSCGMAQAEAWCRQGAVDLLVGGTSRACASTAAPQPPQRADAALRVPPALQARRDADRRAILEDELQTLLQRERDLVAGGADAARQAALRRTQDDVRAVRAELARLPKA